MRIRVTEQTGIRDERLDKGMAGYGEEREVPLFLGMFFVANGWAEDVDGEQEKGTRGSLDYIDPTAWDGKPPAVDRPAIKEIKPHDLKMTVKGKGKK